MKASGRVKGSVTHQVISAKDRQQDFQKGLSDTLKLGVPLLDAPQSGGIETRMELRAGAMGLRDGFQCIAA